MGFKRTQRLVKQGRITPEEALVQNLAWVFEKHFKQAPTVLGPSGEENTPFIAFVLACCAEQDIHMTTARVCDIGRKLGIAEDQPL